MTAGSSEIVAAGANPRAPLYVAINATSQLSGGAGHNDGYCSELSGGARAGSRDLHLAALADSTVP